MRHMWVGERQGVQAAFTRWKRHCTADAFCPSTPPSAFPLCNKQAKLKDLRRAASDAGVQGLALPLAAVSTGGCGRPAEQEEEEEQGSTGADG